MADFVVQNLGSCAGQRAQAVIAQHAEIIAQGHAGEFHAIDNFHRRKSMNVHAGNRAFHGTQDVAIIKRRKTTRESALNAYFFGAECPRLDRFIGYLFWFEKVSIRFARTTAERAKLATYKTDIRKVDVAINDISNDVPGEFGAKEVGGNKQADKIAAISAGEHKGLFATEG